MNIEDFISESIPKIVTTKRPTGILGLDMLLHGGLVTGHIVEIFGEERSGKSTLAYTILANTQDAEDINVAIISATPDGFTKHYAEQCGINLAKLPIIQAHTIEQTLEILFHLLENTKLDLLLIDDLTRSATEKSGYEEGMNKDERIILTNDITKRIQLAIANTETTVVVTTDSTFMRSQVFWLRQRIFTKMLNETTIQATIVRGAGTDVYIPMNIPIILDKGINYELHILQLATGLGIISNEHEYYRFGEILLGHGKQKASQSLISQPETKQEIIDKIIRRFHVF